LGRYALSRAAPAPDGGVWGGLRDARRSGSPPTGAKGMVASAHDCVKGGTRFG